MLCSRHKGALDKGEATMVGDGTEGLDFEIANGGNAGMEEAKHNVDPGRLGMDGAKWVGWRVDEVVEKATGSRHLDACQSRIIILNPIDHLGDEGVESLVVSHEFAGLAFARFDGCANDCLRVKYGTGLKGSDC